MKDPLNLVRLYLDGELGAAQQNELQAWLQADQENQKSFLREVHLHRELRQFALARQYQAAEERSPAQTHRVSPAGNVWKAVPLSWPRLRWVGLAAGMVLLLGLLWTRWLESRPTAADSTETGRAVMVSSRSNDGATPATELALDTLIQTTNAASIRLADRSHFDLAPATTIQALRSSGREQRFQIHAGALLARVAKRQGGAALVLVTPHASVRVLGTEFRLVVEPAGTVLEVFEGAVRVERADGYPSLDLRAGYRLRVQRDQASVQTLLDRGAPGLRWEVWTELSGRQIQDLLADPRFPLEPSHVELLDRFEAPTQWADEYGARLRGYLHPARTGAYTFWIAADDAGELWLSADADPAGQQLICRTDTFTQPHEWDRSALQRSAPIHLTAGHIYYIEALHKEGGGGDCLAVAWEGPDLARQVISQPFLSTIPRQP